MLNSVARSAVSKVVDPIGRAFLRIGLTPDAVTLIGTAGVVIGAVVLFPLGHLLAGTLVITAFVLFDLIDGAMARARGHGTDFGVVLDATCDRIADGAVFGAIAYYCFTRGDAPEIGVAALICLVTAQVISYVKARADSVNLKIGGALAERAERNLLALFGTGLAGMGIPHVLAILLWILAAASAATVVQRLLQVRKAYLDRESTAATGPAPDRAPGQQP
ncbi:phosphatidylinositol phosphate synthase [Nakamurella lactea]|uniref:phosphatidylinositol phosphate synthase n=1 Tax=Nakamurella lactea TaxID=459515 RepID=UPI0003FCA8B8|nr:CDP-alcohol phosphatidyltransferase family protein [Nakamurella lactea]